LLLVLGVIVKVWLPLHATDTFPDGLMAPPEVLLAEITELTDAKLAVMVTSSFLTERFALALLGLSMLPCPEIVQF
jgi:hypothetical protein